MSGWWKLQRQAEAAGRDASSKARGAGPPTSHLQTQRCSLRAPWLRWRHSVWKLPEPCLPPTRHKMPSNVGMKCS